MAKKKQSIKKEENVELSFIEETKVVEYKELSELSKSEHRHYLRTGILPEKNKNKVNRYTRFDTDNIKFGF